MIKSLRVPASQQGYKNKDVFDVGTFIQQLLQASPKGTEQESASAQTLKSYLAHQEKETVAVLSCINPNILPPWKFQLTTTDLVHLYVTLSEKTKAVQHREQRTHELFWNRVDPSAT